VIASVEQATPEMLKITYTTLIPNTDRNWEFASPDGYAYIRERDGAN